MRPPNRGRGGRLLPLALATMATQASVVVLAPILVAIGRDFGASVGAVGQARAINAATAVGASLLVGPLIDRIGVRAPLLWGSGLAVAGALAAAAAPSLGFLYAAQVLTGLGVAGLLTGGFAGVAAAFSERDRVWAMGYVIASQSIAWIVGLPLMGVLADLGSWRLAFAVPVIAALATGVAAWRGASSGRSGPGGGLRLVLRTASARNWALAELVAYAAWTSEITYIGAFYITEYDVSTTAVGLLLAAGPAVFAAVTLLTARLLRRIERRMAISLAALGMALTLPVSFNFAPAIGFTLAIFAVVACFAGIRSTGSSSLGLVQLPNQPGSMMAARTGAAQMGYMLGAAGGGLLIDGPGFGALGIVLGAVMVLAALLVQRVEDPQTEGIGPLPDPVD